MTAQYGKITNQLIAEIKKTHQTSQGEYYEIVLGEPFVEAFRLLRECGGHFIPTSGRMYCPVARWHEYDGELRVLEAALDARDDTFKANQSLLHEELLALSEDI